MHHLIACRIALPILLILTLVPAGAAAAADAASFVSQSVPTALKPGQTATFTVTMHNTGTTTWTAAAGYRLGSSNPQDNFTWGTNRVLLGGGDSIAPGQQKTFTFTLTAPVTAGFHNFQWRMLREGVAWFGAYSTNVAVNVTSANVNASEFVSHSAPNSLNTGQTTSVSVTMRNLGNTVWVRNGSLGWKLGSWNPQDNFTWGTNRVLLSTGDAIGPGQQKTFTFNITAPGTAGSYNFQWRMLEETVAWFGATSANKVIQVNQAPQQVTVCSGVTTTLDGVTDNAPALRQCIQNTPAGGTLQIPVGVYTLYTAVPITRSMTLRTSGTAGVNQNCEQAGVQCATLRAAASFSGVNGILTVDNRSAVTVDHLIIDGNRGARLGSANASQCAAGSNRYGYNVRLSGCASCAFRYNVSKNTLCGTALEWRGDDAVIVGNVIRDNGQNAVNNMWADGITLLQSDRATVTDNLLVNSSDVALILGGTRNGLVTRNTIQQTGQVTFAGLMLDNFNGSTHGDFTGTTVSVNTVSCGNQLCHFGINLGPHPWYQPPSNTLGGTVTGNTVTNARQGINVDGAGTPGAPLVLYNNPASGSPSSASFLCGTMPTSNLNIYTAHSVVNRNGDTAPATNRQWHNCP